MESEQTNISQLQLPHNQSDPPSNNEEQMPELIDTTS